VPELRDALRRAADPPPPSAFDERAVRTRVRRRRGLRRGAMVAVLLAVAVWGANGLAPRRDVTLEQPPSGSVRVFATTDDALLTVTLGEHQVQRRTVPELAPGDPPFRLAARGGRLVFYGEDSGNTYVLDPDWPGPRLLGASLYFVPSAHPDRVWLVEGLSTAGVDSVREVTVDGTVTVPEASAPIGTPLLGVDGGLVLQTDQGLDVWDSASGEVVRRLPGLFPVAATGNVVAWCDRLCTELHLTDVRSGDDVVVERPAGAGPFSGFGSFSPNGETLAVRAEQDGLVLVDTASGEASVVQGGDADFEMAWTPTGDRLLFSLPDGRLFYVLAGSNTALPTGAHLGQVYGLAALPPR
jgi:hypothetical protein